MGTSLLPDLRITPNTQIADEQGRPTRNFLLWIEQRDLNRDAKIEALENTVANMQTVIASLDARITALGG